MFESIRQGLQGENLLKPLCMMFHRYVHGSLTAKAQA